MFAGGRAYHAQPWVRLLDRPQGEAAEGTHEVRAAGGEAHNACQSACAVGPPRRAGDPHRDGGEGRAPVECEEGLEGLRLVLARTRRVVQPDVARGDGDRQAIAAGLARGSAAGECEERRRTDCGGHLRWCQGGHLVVAVARQLCPVTRGLRAQVGGAAPDPIPRVEPILRHTCRARRLHPRHRCASEGPARPAQGSPGPEGLGGLRQHGPSLG
mmetsp:Transcript_114467/g.319870  ORF Transcript_114467/g.319870 Transcript_114467/m.319870 type:complete len:214 (-) Transcript_114467:344-985(-)